MLDQIFSIDCSRPSVVQKGAERAVLCVVRADQLERLIFPGGRIDLTTASLRRQVSSLVPPDLSVLFGSWNCFAT